MISNIEFGNFFILLDKETSESDLLRALFEVPEPKGHVQDSAIWAKWSVLECNQSVSVTKVSLTVGAVIFNKPNEISPKLESEAVSHWSLSNGQAVKD